MSADARSLADLVTRVQQAFLDLPDLAMTVTQACAQFEIEEQACEAVLDLLADAKVLTKRPDGAYVRLARESRVLPRGMSRPQLVTLPRTVAFITRDELARLAFQSRQSRRVA